MSLVMPDPSQRVPLQNKYFFKNKFGPFEMFMEKQQCDEFVVNYYFWGDLPRRAVVPAAPT